AVIMTMALLGPGVMLVANANAIMEKNGLMQSGRSRSGGSGEVGRKRRQNCIDARETERACGPGARPFPPGPGTAGAPLHPARGFPPVGGGRLRFSPRILLLQDSLSRVSPVFHWKQDVRLLASRARKYRIVFIPPHRSR